MSGPLHSELVRRLAALRTCDDAPAQFWPALLQILAGFSEAGSVHLHRLVSESGSTPAWRRLAAFPAKSQPAEEVEAVLMAALSGAVLQSHLLASKERILTLRLDTGEPGAPPVLLFREAPEPSTATRLALELAADTPALYLRHHRQSTARREAEVFSSALEVLSLLNRESKFGAAAVLVVNELAARLGADRVSLGWLEGGELVKVKALSGADKFERRTEALRALELAQEECLDQDETILFPAPDGADTVTRDHASYAGMAGLKSVLSTPLRIEGEPVAVLLVERASGEFDPETPAHLRMYADQIARRLADLYERSRPFPLRWAACLKRWGALWVGPRHTTAKLAAIAGALALAILILGHLPYRVKAPFLLRSEQVVYVTAPFDGFLSEAPARPGDVLGPDDILARFDIRELLLEEALAQADQTRHLREAERARSRNELAELRIAEALAAQSAARLEQVRQRLARSVLKPGFAATVAEGDQRQRIGAPVRAGDVLYQVARLDRMAVEVQVDERDIHQVRVGARVRIAFESRPSETFELRVDRIEPSARSTSRGGVFTVRCVFSEDVPEWWRPGMGGVAKIETRWRSILWILTHRTMDYLRLNWWWW